jgi:hypothetical protein
MRGKSVRKRQRRVIDGTFSFDFKTLPYFVVKVQVKISSLAFIQVDTFLTILKLSKNLFKISALTQIN